MCSFQSDFVQQTLQDMKMRRSTTTSAVSPVTSDHEYTTPNSGAMKLIPASVDYLETNV